MAISLSIGDNGIITSARNATEQWEQGAANEQDELKQIADFINNNNGNNEEDDIIGLNDVPIPKGFYYVGGTKTDGIVISDNQADENKYKEQTEAGNSQIPGDGLVGNQFVWVPVENIADFAVYPGYHSGSASSSIYSYSEQPTNEYNLMKASVEKNHGFYVARYEAGKEIINGEGTVVSKKSADVWNNIKFDGIPEEDYNEEETSDNGAMAKANGMYTDKNKYAVTSTLIYEEQWDAIMAWIDPNFKTSSCEESSFVRDSSGKGNYGNGNIATCGSNDAYRVNNIYDLAGNAAEWNIKYNGESGSARGGAYRSYSGKYDPASCRDFLEPQKDDFYEIYGFRVALYL